MIQIKHDHLDTFAQKHFDAIKEHLDNRSRNVSYNDINNWFLNNGANLSFKDVVLADYANLTTIKDSYRNHAPFPKEVLFLKDNLYTEYFANSSKSIGSNGYNAAELVENLQVKVCPYCNRNYINNVSYANRGLRRTSQIDHYYCKEKYPFLAMSFFNLIPSCSSCNHIKSNKDISYSPYDTTHKTSNLLTFGWDIKSTQFIQDENYLDIKIYSNNATMAKNIEVFSLESLYSMHKDTVQEMYKKKLMYSDTKLEELSSDFSHLFGDIEELKRVVFGNYMDDSQLHKRPLAKLMYDIYLDMPM